MHQTFIGEELFLVTKLITAKFGLPSALTNDANAAAVGEMNYGAARGIRLDVL